MVQHCVTSSSESSSLQDTFWNENQKPLWSRKQDLILFLWFLFWEPWKITGLTRSLTPKGNRHIKVEPSTSLFLVFLDSFLFLSIFLFHFSFLICDGGNVGLAERQLWPRSTNISPPDTPSAIAPRESPRRWPADRPLNSGKHRWHGAQCCDKNLGNFYVSIRTKYVHR